MEEEIRDNYLLCDEEEKLKEYISLLLEKIDKLTKKNTENQECIEEIENQLEQLKEENEEQKQIIARLEKFAPEPDIDAYINANVDEVEDHR